MAQQYGQPREGNWETKTELSPGGSHTLTRPWRWLSTLQIKQQGGNTCFKETAPESKTRSAISCFHFCLWESPSLLAASLWNTAITAESICEHYHSVTGHPETEGNSLRMQWLCCFVDIILEFTWGNVRENHNIILLLRRGGAGGRDWQWFNLGVLQTILWKKIQIKNSRTEQYSTILTHTTKYHSDDVLLVKDQKCYTNEQKTCFVKMVYSMYWYAEQRKY